MYLRDHLPQRQPPVMRPHHGEARAVGEAVPVAVGAIGHQPVYMHTSVRGV